MNYKISIIVPIYNVEKYIGKCLTSLINQTYKNLEILLINDGTKDNSIKEVEKFNDKRIRLYNKKNGGLSSARNFGLKFATGDYVMFVDSDDWLDVFCVEKCVNELEKKDYDLIYFPYIREYLDGSYPRTTYTENKVFGSQKEVLNNIVRKLIGPINNELKYPTMMESNNTAWAKLYKKSIIENIEFTDLKITATEDLVFNIKACCKVTSAKFITSTYYHYNKTNISSITKTETYDLLKRWKYLFREIENEMKKNNLDDDFFVQAFNNRKVINLLGINMKVYTMDCGIIKKCKIINYILSDEIFQEAFKNFSFKNLEFKWKLYYKLCKYKLSILILIMQYFANKLKKYS